MGGCCKFRNAGAGEGNRTLVVSLEGFCSTIELHPHGSHHKTHSVGGGGWIRTNVGVSQQIYSLPPLATRAPLHAEPVTIHLSVEGVKLLRRTNRKKIQGASIGLGVKDAGRHVSICLVEPDLNLTDPPKLKRVTDHLDGWQ